MTSVLIAALLLAQQATPPEKCSISGTVMDSITGLPLSKVYLVAAHPSGRDASASTTTDAAGKFRMVNVDPGEYRLSAKRNGYLDAFYGARKSSADGSMIVLSAGQKLEDLQIRMAPFGVIAGTLKDPDGEPLAGVFVDVYSPKYVDGQRKILQFDNAVTDDLGHYRIAGLPPGKYYVSATPPSQEDRRARVVDHSVKSDKLREIAIRTFYPGVADPSAASLVELSSGTRATGIDITLTRSAVYKVAVHLDFTDGHKATASLLNSAEGFGGLGSLRDVNPDGDMEIEGVPPGNYRIEIGTLGPSKFFTGRQEVNCTTSVPLNVDKADVTGLRIATTGCPTVAGHVVVEGEQQKKVPDGSNYLIDFHPGPRERVEPDGSFEATVSPGTNIVDLLGITGMSGLYVKSMQAGSQDVLRNGLTLSGSERADLQITLAPHGGKIDGVVLNAEGNPVLGAAVVLIPNDNALRPRLDFTRDTVTDKAGHFDLKGLAPGEYKLFAWDDIEKDSWFDPDILKDYEAKGKPVSVKASDTEQASQTVDLLLQ